MPISAPKPNSPPSQNCVEAFHIATALSMPAMKRCAAASSAVTMASVCSLPWRRTCAIAASTPSTTATERIESSHSVSKSASPAAVSPGTIARARASARKSQPSARRSAISTGSSESATAASISNVSVAPQMPVRRIFAFARMRRAISGSAAAWM